MHRHRSPKIFKLSRQLFPILPTEKICNSFTHLHTRTGGGRSRELALLLLHRIITSALTKLLNLSTNVNQDGVDRV